MVKGLGEVKMYKFITAIQWLYNKKIKEVKRKQHAAIRQLGVTTISK